MEINALCLSKRGIPRLSAVFLQSVIAAGLSVDEIWRRALISDLLEVTEATGEPPRGTIPILMSESHATSLGKACVVQVEDAVNVAHAEQRNEKAARAKSRALKLVLTDGAQHFPAFEFSPILSWSLDSLAPGTKLLLKPNSCIRRGQLLLGPRDVTILGSGLPVENPWGAARWKRLTQPQPRGPGLFSRLAADNEEQLENDDAGICVTAIPTVLPPEMATHSPDDFEFDSDDIAALEASGF